jgi:hypothetical protein
MDPEATWQRIVDAWKAGEGEELLAAVGDLAKWLRRGGSVPPSLARRKFSGAVLSALLDNVETVLLWVQSDASDD